MRATETLGFEVHFILLPSRQMGECDIPRHVAEFPERFHLLKRPRLANASYLAQRATLKSFRKLTRTTVRLSNVDETYLEGFAAQITQIDLAQRFDIAIVEYVSFSKALLSFRKAVHKVIDTHDSFEGQLTRSEERRGLIRADTIFAIQEREAEIFRALLATDSDKVTTVSHFIEAKDIVDTQTCGGAAFIGSSFVQNNISLSWFIEKVLPLVLEQEPHFTLTVAGSVGQAVPDAPAVKKIGRVQKFQDAFLRAPILVNCITVGTGIKIKLLEAFGAGIPVVSTELGVEGIPPRFLSGTTVVPNNDPQAFADAVVEMVRSPTKRAEMSMLNAKIRNEWNKKQLHNLACALDRFTGNELDDMSKDEQAQRSRGT